MRAATPLRLLSAALIVAFAFSLAAAPDAQAQKRGEAKAPGEALLALFEAARSGDGDPHLPYVLTSLKKALTSQDAIALLELVDPAYFKDQFGAMNTKGRSPGAALNQFTCEMLGICDVSKSYRLNDVVSMLVVSAEPGKDLRPKTDADGQPLGPPTKVFDVKIEMKMWDGVTIISTIFYNTSTTKLFGPVG